MQQHAKLYAECASTVRDNAALIQKFTCKNYNQIHAQLHTLTRVNFLLQFRMSIGAGLGLGLGLGLASALPSGLGLGLFAASPSVSAKNTGPLLPGLGGHPSC